MNRYTLTADGNRWWWGPALAGTMSSAAVVAVVALPVAGQAMPVTTTRHESVSTYVVESGTDPLGPVVGQCFLHRATWNEALDWPQPKCRHGAQEVAEPAGPRVIRSGLDWRP